MDQDTIEHAQSYALERGCDYVAVIDERSIGGDVYIQPAVTLGLLNPYCREAKRRGAVVEIWALGEDNIECGQSWRKVA